MGNEVAHSGGVALDTKILLRIFYFFICDPIYYETTCQNENIYKEYARRERIIILVMKAKYVSITQ